MKKNNKNPLNPKNTNENELLQDLETLEKMGLITSKMISGEKQYSLTDFGELISKTGMKSKLSLN